MEEPRPDKFRFKKRVGITRNSEGLKYICAMRLTDTHTHLYVREFDEDREAMMRRAMDKGVDRFFLPAIDASYYPKMLELENRYPGQVYLMAGLHPTHVGEDYEKELQVVEQMLRTHRFYAIGEIGMDLYWDKTHVDEQKKAFEQQIIWAKERQLPIVIHSRDAFDEIFEVMDRMFDERLRGIFHCFTGNEEQAKKILAYGFKIGIGGVITFKNGKIDQFLHRIPIEHVVLETDSPYLAPVPYRGKRNESAYLTYVLDKVSELYGMDPRVVASITSRNAEEVFGLKALG